MAPKDMYCDLDEQTLRELLVKALDSLSSLTGTEKTAKEEEIGKIKHWLKDAYDERSRKEHGLNGTLGSSYSNPERNQRMRDLKIAVDSIMRFSPGMCVQVFINQLTNKHKLYVECEDKSDQAVLETSFLRHAQSRLCDDFLTQITNDSKTFSTLEEFTDYLSENYDTKQTIYQRMETLLSIQPKTNENWSEFTARLANSGHELLLMMSGRAKTKFSKDLTTKQFMEILMGQVLLNSIQTSTRSREVYKLMAPTLDDVWSVNELSNRAMAISDRVSDFGDGGGYVAKSRKSFNVNSSGGGRDKKKTPIKDQKCYFWMDGDCRKGDECPRRHDPEDFGVGRPKSKSSEPKSMMSLASFQN